MTGAMLEDAILTMQLPFEYHQILSMDLSNEAKSRVCAVGILSVSELWVLFTKSRVIFRPRNIYNELIWDF